MTSPNDAPSAHLSTFTTADGETLGVLDWPTAQPARRGTVLMVHGLGEHMGRYAHVAQALNGWGFDARGYDHYGHGRSSGPRGGLTHDQRLLTDLAEIIDDTRKRMSPGEPLVLLGHSLGGLVAAHFVSLDRRPVDALVLSSPGLDAGFSAVQKLLLAVLPRLAPNLRVDNGLDVQGLSHDPAVVAAYQADPLCHDRVCGRLARYAANAGQTTVAAASQWSVPTLLMWAGDDRLVQAATTAAFAAAAPPGVVQSQCFASHFHEIFNETPERAAPVFALLESWLTQRFPAQVQAATPDCSATTAAAAAATDSHNI